MISPKKTVALCILAHDAPDILSAIVERCASDDVSILIHIDNKSDIETFYNICGATVLEKRESIFWGGSGMMKATKSLLEKAIEDPNISYVTLCSGRCFPIVIPSEYGKTIDLQVNYIEYRRLPRDDWYKGGLDRVKYRYISKNPYSFISKAFLAMQKAVFYSTNLDKKLKLYGGSQWFNLTRHAVEIILNNWDKYAKLLRHAKIQDEILLHTIFANECDHLPVNNTSLRYMHFEHGKPHPCFLKSSILSKEEFKNNLFARKVATINEFEALASL